MPSTKAKPSPFEGVTPLSTIVGTYETGKGDFEGLMLNTRPNILALLAELAAWDEEIFIATKAGQYINPQLSPEARETFYFVVKRFLWKIGQLYGVESRYRKYLTLQDMTWEAMMQILTTSQDEPRGMPKEFAKQGKEVAAMLSRGELWDALFFNYDIDRCAEDYREHEALKIGLRSLARTNWEGGIFRGKIVDKAFYGIKKSRPHCQRGSSKKSEPEPHEIHLGAKIETSFAQGGEVRPGANWPNAFIYQTELNVDGENINKGRVIDCIGKIKASRIENSLLVVGNNLIVEGCEFYAGELVLENKANTQFNYVFFYGKLKIDCSQITEGSDFIIFNYCDFSQIQLSDEVLAKIAKVSKDCIFSKKQLGTLAQLGIGIEDAKTCDAMNESIQKVVGTKRGDSDERIYMAALNASLLAPTNKCLGTDYRDPARKDIADVPVLRGENVLQFAQELGLKGNDLRTIFPAVPGIEIESLPKRMAFFKALMAFVDGRRGKIPFKDWMQFLKDYGKEACEVLGISEELLTFHNGLNTLPPLKKSNGDTHNHGKCCWAKIQYYYLGKDGEITGCHEADIIISSERGLRDILIEYDEKDYWNNKRKSMATQSRLQLMAELLEELFVKLHSYGLYLGDLINHHAYQWPEVDPDTSAYVLSNFYHPNLPGKIGEGEMALNDIKLEGNQVTVLTGPNQEAGKTFTQTAVAHIISQAHSGAPCPAQVKIPVNMAFDHILSLPNIRGQAGGEHSAAKERFVALNLFIDKLESLAGTKEIPTRVLVTLDEIMMGVTNTRDAHTAELNFINTLMTIEGLQVTLLLIEPDAVEIVPILQNNPTWGQQVVIMSADLHSRHKFKVTDTPLSSSPEAVMAELEHGAELLRVAPWHILEKS